MLHADTEVAQGGVRGGGRDWKDGRMEWWNDGILEGWGEKNLE